jgi:PIN domain nuclease of toxin-antitoxin system
MCKSVITRMRWAIHVAPIGKWEMHIEYSWGNLKKKTEIGKPVERWKNNKMDLKETDLEGMDWINVALDRDKLWAVVKMVVNSRVQTYVELLE